MKNNKIETLIAKEFNKLEHVEAVLLAGSRVVNNTDADSDYDMYMYTTKEIDPAEREAIAKMFADYYEINNQFWETGDEWTLRDSGEGIDIMFRSFDWLKGEVERNIINHQANVGYSTCFWYNIKNSEIIYDKGGRLTPFQAEVDVAYPEELKKNIIKKNYPVIRQIRSSYHHQIELAIKRKDRVSINHRVAAVFESYFDILFAVNEMLHPGEKRQMSYLKDKVDKLPTNFETVVNELIDKSITLHPAILDAIDRLMNGLDELLKKEGLNF